MSSAGDDGVTVQIKATTDNLESTFNSAARTVSDGSKEMASGFKDATEATGEHTQALTALREELQGLISPIRGIRANLGELGEAFAVAFGVEKIREFYNEFSELGAESLHLSERLGISVGEMSELGSVAGALGIPLSEAALSFSRLQVNAEKASQGSAAQEAAFRALGVSVTDGTGKLKGLSDLLPEIADRFAATADGPNKLAIATAIGGRGFSEMIPLLDLGADGLAKFNSIAQDTGTKITTDMAEGMEKSAVGSFTLGQAVKGVGLTLYEAFKPALDTIVLSLIDLVEAFNKSIQQGGSLNYVLEALVVVFDTFVTVADSVVVALIEIVDIFNLATNNIGTAAAAIGKATQDAFSGHWAQAKQDVKEGLAQIGSQWDDWAKKSLKDITDFGDRLKNTFSNIGNGVGTGLRTETTPDANKPALPAVDTDAAKIATTQIEAETKAKLAIIAIAEEINSTKLKLSQETADEFYAQELRLEDQKYQIQVAGLTKILGIAGLEKTERAKIIGELTVLEQTHSLAVQKLKDDELVKDQQLRQTELKNFIAEKDEELKTATQSIKDKEALGLISVQEATTTEKQLTLAIEAEILKRFDAENAGLTKGTTAYQKAMAEREKIVSQFTQDIAKITQQAQADDLKKWDTFGNSIRSSFNSTIQGLVNGTETFGQAFSNILVSIVDGFVQMGLDIVEDWAKTQLTNLILTQTTQKSQAGTQIVSNAGIAGSAAFASTAAIPIIGPELAPAAGELAFAGALSYLPFAAGGMELDQDQLVYAHKDEMILPAGISGGLKDLIGSGGSGGGDTHVHGPFVQAIDTQTGMQFLMNNIPKFAKELGRYMAANPSARGDF